MTCGVRSISILDRWEFRGGDSHQRGEKERQRDRDVITKTVRQCVIGGVQIWV